MLNAKNELLSISQQVPGFAERFYGSDFEANMCDDTLFPLLHIQKITSSDVEQNFNTGSWKRSWQVFMFIGDKTDLDTPGTDLDEVENAMAMLTMQYISKINASGLFEPVTRVSMKHQSFKFDFGMSGVIAAITIKEKKGVLACSF